MCLQWRVYIPPGASFFEDVPLVKLFTPMPGGVTLGSSGLCFCVPCLSSAITSLCLLIVHTPVCVFSSRGAPTGEWRELLLETPDTSEPSIPANRDPRDFFLDIIFRPHEFSHKDIIRALSVSVERAFGLILLMSPFRCLYQHPHVCFCSHMYCCPCVLLC